MRALVPVMVALAGGWMLALAPPPACPTLPPPLAQGGLRIAERRLDTWWTYATLDGEVREGSVALTDPLGNLAGRLEGNRLVLPTAPGERIAARLLRTGDIVVLAGDGSGYLGVLLLPPGAALVPGDLFVTHGVLGMPGGLPVARAVATPTGVRAESVAFLSRSAGLAPV